MLLLRSQAWAARLLARIRTAASMVQLLTSNFALIQVSLLAVPTPAHAEGVGPLGEWEAPPIPTHTTLLVNVLVHQGWTWVNHTCACVWG